MPQCTNCGSIEVCSNRMDSAAILRGVRGAHPSLSTGGSLALLAGLHLGNAMRRQWVCTICGHRF